MAGYKEYDYSQGKFIPIHFDKQILPGTFEYSLHYLIDNEIDLSCFDQQHRNDETGALAYNPSILLKIILYAYSQRITSSREIAQCCRENIIFMALSANTEPHFTTIADFISASGQEVIDLFLEVLLICDVMGLIGEEMFVVDGVKLPLNASKEWSGTREDLQKKKERAEYYGEVNFYRPQRDFTISEDKTHCICPAGKRLYCNGGNVIVNGNQAV